MGLLKDIGKAIGKAISTGLSELAHHDKTTSAQGQDSTSTVRSQSTSPPSTSTKTSPVTSTPPGSSPTGSTSTTPESTTTTTTESTTTTKPEATTTDPESSPSITVSGSPKSSTSSNTSFTSSSNGAQTSPSPLKATTDHAFTTSGKNSSSGSSNGSPPTTGSPYQSLSVNSTTASILLSMSTSMPTSPSMPTPNANVPTDTTPKKSHSNAGLIAGAVIGSVMGLVIISLAIFCFRKHYLSSRRSVTKEDREETTAFAKPSIRSMTSHGSMSVLASSLGTPRTSVTIGHRVTYNLGFEDSVRLMEQGILPTQTLMMSMPNPEAPPLDLNMPHTPPTILSAFEHAPYPFIYQKPPRSPSDYSTSMSQTASQVESVSIASEAGVIISSPPPEVHLNFPKATEPDNVDVAVSEILRAMAAQKRHKRQQSISGRLSRSSLQLPFEPFEHPDQTSTDYKVFYDRHNDTPSLVHSNGSPESTWNGYHEN